MVKWPWKRARSGEADVVATAHVSDLRLEAERGRRLVEESREFVLVLDEDERVVAASRRAREALEGVLAGTRVSEEMLLSGSSRTPFRVPYDVDGRRETLLYLSDAGDLAAYEELRAGFTAAVSHELRTPLARLLALLDNATLPGAEVEELIERARGEVAEIGELIDDVLFLSELESGREIVSLGSTPVLPILEDVAAKAADKAARAGIAIGVHGDGDSALPLRPRMLGVVAANLVDNAIRYAGAGATLRLSTERDGDDVVLVASDDGIGVAEEDLARIFERFFRADRARATRGTGLGLAIVKHVVTSAGGRIEARGARGEGLTVRCIFPA